MNSYLTLIIIILAFIAGAMTMDTIKMAKSAYYIESGDMQDCLDKWGAVLKRQQHMPSRLEDSTCPPGWRKNE